LWKKTVTRKEADDLLEDVLDILTELEFGNGDPDTDLHLAKNKLFRFRDEYFKHISGAP
jgi:hypothetical protein